MTENDLRPRIDALPLRAGHESWLLGAFLVFFSVAVAAAMPPISASIRTAMADAAKGEPSKSDSAQRATVRAQTHTLRVLAAQNGAGGDLLPATAILLILPVDGAPLLPRPVDLAARIAERGYTARAPPPISA